MGIYKDDASEVAFLLGGIGTGNISIGSRGDLRDIEIFNEPNKGVKPPFTFFPIWAKEEGKKPISKKIESKLKPPFSTSHGYRPQDTVGIPHLKSSVMKCEYPFVYIDFKDDELPLDIGLEAFNPFIPLNSDDSGIPAILFRYKVKNISSSKIDVSIAGVMANMIGKDWYHKYGGFKGPENKLKNEIVDIPGFSSIYYTSEDLDKDDRYYGNMALSAIGNNISTKSSCLQTGWFDGIQDFWNDFSSDGKLEEVSGLDAIGCQLNVKSGLIGSIARSDTLDPGQEKIFEFIISWYFPNRANNWEECNDSNCGCKENVALTTKNYYSTRFKDSIDVAKYLIDNIGRLEKSSKDFSNALFSSSLPDYVIDALSSNITVLRSPTCFRIEDGTFLGWEGCCDGIGCCPGSCSHVWNYAQTVAFLFPELEQSARREEFSLETDGNGMMLFRFNKMFGGNLWGDELWDTVSAADGQMGTIMRLYREWKISGNTALIKKLWPKVKLALDFALDEWDTDGDLVLDGKKHNTYDIEFYGPEPLSNIMFLGALKAVYLMAEYLRDKEALDKYKKIFKKAEKRIDEMLWNGKYYIQKIDDIDEYKYQFGKGCLSDQMLGQFLAHICGIGYLLPRDHIRSSIKSIYDINFKPDLSKHNCVQRVFALNDEGGLLLCSWPENGRPRLPFIYSDEVWTGVEYQVASHLIFEDYIQEGLNIVKAVRDRHNGYRRNPFNEVECGHHYARSMASWGLLIALSGFRYDMVKSEISFDPKINQENFSCFFSAGKGWGIYKQKKDNKTGEIIKDIKVLYGNLEGIKIR